MGGNTSSNEKPQGEAVVEPGGEIDLEAGLPVPPPAATARTSGADSRPRPSKRTATFSITAATAAAATSRPSNGTTGSTKHPGTGIAGAGVVPPPNTPANTERATRTIRRMFSRSSGKTDGSGRSLRFRPRTEGESGRSGLHISHFLRIAFRSSSTVSCMVNVLWPFVPAAIACRYALSDSPTNNLISFILAYIAMVPCANLIGFAGQELSRKVPHVVGVLTETIVASIVEIVLFIVLLTRGLYVVIQAAILGSVLATMLLCLGMCFFVGGLRRTEQEFSETVSEAGNGLLLTAGFGLAVPTLFEHALSGMVGLDPDDLESRTVNVSRVTSILLIVAYLVFIYFQARTHNSIYDEIFEGEEQRATAFAAESALEHISRGELDYHVDVEREKLTMTECLISLSVAVALVSLIALALVEEIEDIVIERGVSDAFMGLILVPLVEKAAEHLTAINEAWDNQMNFALAHVLGSTIQTAMFNGPLAVIVGWGLHRPMGLDFKIFDMGVLILAIITVGNFLRDQKSNYLEGLLCVIVYIAIAVAAYHYPDVNTRAGGTEEAAEVVGHVARQLLRR
ncbi:Ca2+:H+ antiporter [Sporothrix brasiliensis 5110]|uniref:Vacuolar calcium ion transporter n=1 Tax=Sporothrix brasiliensis 5110 TaxID=1398154 RepID=A0A0C2IVB1_9PEZI|nr:Ca2+:H+ antiporter [Sporothrix brasiliensis 5110]KIH88932.1 Ca2+:H+ antiporter [Sporothrix brasiliensis 5110]